MLQVQGVVLSLQYLIKSTSDKNYWHDDSDDHSLLHRRQQHSFMYDIVDNYVLVLSIHSRQPISPCLLACLLSCLLATVVGT
jgi:hypothetical protein